MLYHHFLCEMNVSHKHLFYQAKTNMPSGDGDGTISYGFAYYTTPQVHQQPIQNKQFRQLYILI